MQSRESLLERRPAQGLPPRTNPAEAANRTALPAPERRERVRVLCHLPLTVKFGRIYESMAQATNISARGMFFVMRQPLRVGSAIELVFRLPRRVIGVDGIWLRCPAEVVRAEEDLPEGKFSIGASIKHYEVFRVS